MSNEPSYFHVRPLAWFKPLFPRNPITTWPKFLCLRFEGHSPSDGLLTLGASAKIWGRHSFSFISFRIVNASHQASRYLALDMFSWMQYKEIKTER